jgi:hypothetical protein
MTHSRERPGRCERSRPTKAAFADHAGCRGDKRNEPEFQAKSRKRIEAAR